MATEEEAREAFAAVAQDNYEGLDKILARIATANDISPHQIMESLRDDIDRSSGRQEWVGMSTGRQRKAMELFLNHLSANDNIPDFAARRAHGVRMLRNIDAAMGNILPEVQNRLYRARRTLQMDIMVDNMMGNL